MTTREVVKLCSNCMHVLALTIIAARSIERHPSRDKGAAQSVLKRGSRHLGAIFEKEPHFSQVQGRCSGVGLE